MAGRRFLARVTEAAAGHRLAHHRACRRFALDRVVPLAILLFKSERGDLSLGLGCRALGRQRIISGIETTRPSCCARVGVLGAPAG